LELGKLLQEISTKMMDKTARHITVAERETFGRMKALHTNILEVNREAGKDDSNRENGQDAAIVCSKCSRSLQSADKEQQATPVWRGHAAAQTEPWRRLEDTQLNWPHHPRAQCSRKVTKLPGAPKRTCQEGHKKEQREAESQSAVIRLPYSLGKADLHRGEVRIGWTICILFRVTRVTGSPAF